MSPRLILRGVCVLCIHPFPDERIQRRQASLAKFSVLRNLFHWASLHDGTFG